MTAKKTCWWCNEMMGNETGTTELPDKTEVSIHFHCYKELTDKKMKQRLEELTSNMRKHQEEAPAECIDESDTIKMLNAILFAYQDAGTFPDARDENGKFTSNTDLFHQVLATFRWLRKNKCLWNHKLGPLIDVIETWRKRDATASKTIATMQSDLDVARQKIKELQEILEP